MSDRQLAQMIDLALPTADDWLRIQRLSQTDNEDMKFLTDCLFRVFGAYSQYVIDGFIAYCESNDLIEEINATHVPVEAIDARALENAKLDRHSSFLFADEVST